MANTKNPFLSALNNRQLADSPAPETTEPEEEEKNPFLRALNRKQEAGSTGASGTTGTTAAYGTDNPFLRAYYRKNDPVYQAYSQSGYEGISDLFAGFQSGQKTYSEVTDYLGNTRKYITDNAKVLGDSAAEMLKNMDYYDSYGQYLFAIEEEKKKDAEKAKTAASGIGGWRYNSKDGVNIEAPDGNAGTADFNYPAYRKYVKQKQGAQSEILEYEKAVQDQKADFDKRYANDNAFRYSVDMSADEISAELEKSQEEMTALSWQSWEEYQANPNRGYELQKYINDLQSAQQMQTQTANAEHISEILENPDFERYLSDTQEKKSKDKYWREDYYTDQIFGGKHLVSAFGEKTARAQSSRTMTPEEAEALTQLVADNENDYMIAIDWCTDEELTAFRYIWDNGTPEDVVIFLDAIKADAIEKEHKYAAELMSGTPFMRFVTSVASVPLNTAAGIEWLANEGHMLLYGADSGSRKLDAAEMVSQIRGTNAEKLTEKGLFNKGLLAGEANLPGWMPIKSLGDAYQLGMSFVDSQVNAGMIRGAKNALALGDAATKALEAASVISLGTSAGASRYNEILDNGGTYAQAMVASLTAASYEALTEFLSLDKLVNPDAMKSAVSNILTQSAIEGSEELSSTLLNGVTDWITAYYNGGNYSELLNMYNGLIAEGTDSKTAVLRCIEKLGSDMVSDFIGGAISGAAGMGLSMATSGISYRGSKNQRVYNVQETNALKAFAEDNNLKFDASKQSEIRKTGNKFVQSVTNELKNAASITEAEKIAQKYENKYGTEISQIVTDAFADSVSRKFNQAKTVQELDKMYESASVQGVSVTSDSSQFAQIAARAYAERAAQITAKQNSASYEDIVQAAVKPYISDTNTRSSAENTVTVTDEGGNAVELRVSRITDDGKLILSDGQTVSAESAAMSPGMSDVYAVAQKIGGAYGALMFLHYLDAASKGQVNAEEFSKRFDELFSFGKTGNFTEQEAVEYAKKKGGIAESYAAAAYRLGKDMADYETGKARKKLNEAQRERRAATEHTATGKVGKVNRAGISNTVMTKEVRSQIRLAETLAKRLGVNVRLVDTKSNINGAYKDGTITLNVRQAINNTGAKAFLLKVMGHELTHSLQRYSPELYQGLKAFITSELTAELGAEGFHDLVEQKQMEYQQAGKELNDKDLMNTTFEQAVDEVIADSCEMMLKDSKVLSDLYRKNATLYERVKDFIADFLARMQKAFEGASPSHLESEIMMRRAAEQLQQMWDNALADAVQTAAEIKNTATEDGGKIQLAISSLDDITPENVEKTLNEVLNGEHISKKEYIPLMRDTPDIPKYFFGITEDAPVVADTRKAYFDMREDGALKEDKQHHYHGLGVEGYIKRINAIENPEYIIYENNGNYAIIVQPESQDSWVIFEYGYNINPAYAEYGGGLGNVAVTVFDEYSEEEFVEKFSDEYVPGDVESYFDLVLKKGGTIIYNKSSDYERIIDIIAEQKKKQNRKEVHGGKSRSLLNGTVSKNSIPNPSENVNTSGEKISSDAEYLSLAEKYRDGTATEEETEQLRKAVEQAAKKAMPNTKVVDGNGNLQTVFHGTNSREEKSRWNSDTRSFDTEYRQFYVFKKTYDEQSGHFFSGDLDNAGSYGGTVYSCFLNITNPLVIDCKGSGYDAVSFNGVVKDTYEWAAWAKKNGYNGVIFHNVFDGAGFSELKNTTTDYVAFYSNQIKSADLVTYDDNGNIIPLSERFNQEKSDIRFSISTGADAVSDEELLWQMRLEDAANSDEKDALRRAKEQIGNIRSLREQLSEAKRQLKTTNRELNTKGLSAFAKDLALKFGIKDSGMQKTVREQITGLYQRLLDMIDNGKEEQSFQSLRDGARDIAEWLINNGYISEKQGYKWFTHSFASEFARTSEERAGIVADVSSQIIEDFAIYRAREAVQMTEADRLVQQVKDQYSGKLTQTRDQLLSAQSENIRLSEQNTALSTANEELREFTEYMQDYVEQKKEELASAKREAKQSDKLSERQEKKIEKLTAELRAANAEVRAWQEKSRHAESLIRAALKSKNVDIRKLEDRVHSLTVENANARYDAQLQLAWARAEESHTLQNHKAEVKQLQRQLLRAEDRINRMITQKELQTVLSSERKKAAEEMRQKKDEQFKRYKDERGKTELRRKIRNLRDNLQKRFTNPGENTYVPIGLAQSIIDVVDMIDIGAESVEVPEPKEVDGQYVIKMQQGYLDGQYTKSGNPKPNIVKITGDTEQECIEKAIAEKERYTAEKGRTKSAEKYRSANEAMLAVYNQYQALQENEDFVWKSEYDEETAKQIGTLVARLNYSSELNENGQYAIRDMSKEDLQAVYETLRGVTESLRNATKLLAQDSRISVYQAMETLVNETLNGRRAKKNMQKPKGNRAGELTGLNVMRAALLMSNMREDAQLYKMWRAIETGEELATRYVMNYNKRLQELKSGKNEMTYLNALNKKIDFGIKDAQTGTPVLMTKMQLMQAMMTWEREAHSDKLKHIERGFMKIRDAAAIAKGDTETANHNARVVKFDAEIYDAMKNHLTAWDRQFMSAIRDYLSKTEIGAVNEVMYQLKHRTLTGEEFYFPVFTDKNYLSTELEGQRDATNLFVRQPGSTKALQTNASTPIVIDGLDTVMSRHVQEIANYVGLALPIRDFAKVYNARQSSKEGVYRMSAKEAIERAWGNIANKILEDNIRDVQKISRAARDNSSVAKIGEKLQSVFVKAALVGRVSVVIKQAASYQAAGSVISDRALLKHEAEIIGYFLSPGSKAAQKLFNEIDAHTSLHYNRRLGMSMQEIAEEKQKVTGIRKAASYAGAWLEQGEVRHKLRNAIEVLNIETAIQRMDVATTAVLWNACKSDVRQDFRKENKGTDTDDFWKEVTRRYEKAIRETQPMYDALHRTENAKSKNLLNSTLGVFKTVPYQNKGQIKMAVAAFEEARATGTKQEAQAAFNHAFKTMWANTHSALVFSLMTLIAQALRHKMKKYRNDDDELTFGSVLMAYGKDVLNVWMSNISPIFGGLAMELADRFITGNRGGYDVFSAGILDLLNDSEIQIEKLIEVSAKCATGEASTSKLVSQIENTVLDLANYTGLPLKNVRDTLGGIIGNIKDIEAGYFPAFNNANEKTKSVNAKRYTDALIAGNRSKANDVYHEMWKQEREKYLADGLSADTASESATKSADNAVKNYVQDQYKADKITRKDALSVLTKVIGKEDAESKLHYWDFQLNYPEYEKYDLSEKKVNDYYTAIKSTGMPLREYVRYCVKVKDCKGVDEDGDGKTDSGSKKAAILKVIDELPITKAQKDALYYLNDYSESKIEEAPWH